MTELSGRISRTSHCLPHQLNNSDLRFQDKQAKQEMQAHWLLPHEHDKWKSQQLFITQALFLVFMTLSLYIYTLSFTYRLFLRAY